MADLNTSLMTYLCTFYGLTPGAAGARDLTTLITKYLASLTGDYTARWKQMEQSALA
jgi:hypothetical protein